MSLFKKAMSLVLAVVLSACGGGGGSSGSNSGTGNGAGGGGGTGTTTSTAASLKVALSKVALSKVQAGVTTVVTGIDVSNTATYYAKATLLDGSGAAIPNKLVTFTLSSTIATLSSTTALTDSAGVATVGIAPSAGSSSGAASLIATATVSNASASGQADFSSTGAGVSAVTMTASLIDSSGVAVTSIGSSGYKAKATLKDGNGVPLVGRLVNFSLNTSLATLTSLTALTDQNGIATVGISSVAGSAAGAATLTVSAVASGASVSDSTDFAFSAAAITLSTIAGSTSLPSGGNTPLSLTAFIGGVPAGATPVNITFTASCGSINGSIGSAGVTTNGSGVASANYSAVKADGTPCDGAVTVGATTGSVSAPPLTVTVASPVASSVAYMGSTLTQVFIAGFGAPTDSVLTFKVLTSTATPSTNTPVAFSIETNPGGVVLSSTTGSTDNNGLVTVKITSGGKAGPLKVRATIVGNGAYAESQNLTVASGPPSQRYMSVSLSAFNVEGQNNDGVTSTITVRLADRQGNPVQDGTVVNFTASGGQVATSCATVKVSGIAQCSVIWQSQDPRPTNGRVAVLAYTVGTKDYLDRDSSNTFNVQSPPSAALDDKLIELGNVFRDDDENGFYDSSIDRFYLDLKGVNSSSTNGSQVSVCPASGEPTPSDPGTCDGKLATVIRQQVIILNSSSHSETITADLYDASTLGDSPDAHNMKEITNSQFKFVLRSLNNRKLPMPVGTTIVASPLTNTSVCKVTSVAPSTVGNVAPTMVANAVYPDLATSHTVSLAGCSPGDIINLAITAPSGTNDNYPIKLP